MDSGNLTLNADRVADLRRRYRVKQFDVFGSRARGETGAGSDLDSMVTFEPDARIGLEFVALKEELEALTGLSVDLVTRSSIELSPNKYFRHFALCRTTPLG